LGKELISLILAWGGKGKGISRGQGSGIRDQRGWIGDKERRGETEIREDGWGERGWQS